MGLHKRPTVGSGAVAAGTYAGGSGWPKKPDDGSSKPPEKPTIQPEKVQPPEKTAPTETKKPQEQIKSDNQRYVSFSSSSEYVAHFQKMIEEKKIGTMSITDALDAIDEKNAQLKELTKDAQKLERDAAVAKNNTIELEDRLTGKTQARLEQYNKDANARLLTEGLSNDDVQEILYEIKYNNEAIAKANALKSLPKQEQEKMLNDLKTIEKQKTEIASQAKLDIEQTKTDIEELISQTTAAKKELSEDIHNSLIEPSRKTITKPVFAEDIERKLEIHNNTGQGEWDESRLGYKPGTKLEEFAQNHDLTLVQSHISEAFNWVQEMMPGHVADGLIQMRGTTFNRSQKEGDQRNTSAMKVFDPKTHKFLDDYEFASSMIEFSPPNMQESNFQKWIKSRKDSGIDSTLPDGVKTYKEFQSWAVNAVQSAPEFSSENLRVHIDLVNGRSFYRAPEASPSSYMIDGKPFKFLASAAADGGNPPNGISIAPHKMDLFQKSYEKTVSSTFDADESRVAVKKELQASAVHEFGHYLEHTSPEITKIMSDFLDRRTQGEKLRHLAEDMPNQGFRKDELYLEGGFIHKYVGKQYIRGGVDAFTGNPIPGQSTERMTSTTEVFSMGLENLFKDPVNFLQKDPDHFAAMIAALKSVKH